MFEVDEISNGFHDILSKYHDAPIMDLYVSDSMQDMLDIDIKSEVATVVGGASEFTSLMNFDLPALELDSNSNDASSVGGSGSSSNGWYNGVIGGPTRWSSGDIYADVGACVNPNSVMPVITQSLLKSPKQSSNVNLNMTAVGNGSASGDPTLPSPKERKSHLTFSPNTIKVPVVVQEAKKLSSITTSSSSIGSNGTTSGSGIGGGLTPLQRINGGAADAVKKDLSSQMLLKEEGGNKIIIRNHQTVTASGGTNTTTSSPGSNTTGTGLGVGLGKGNTIKLAAGIGGLTFANGVQFKNLKHVQKISAISPNGALKRDVSSPARIVNGSVHHHHQTQQQQLTLNNGLTPKLINRNVIMHHHPAANGKPLQQMVGGAALASSNQQQMTMVNGTTSVAATTPKIVTKLAKPNGVSEFPKPAYSYSCLIAMALKNSRSGSLPVSEIYSFMCEHFPYFKTAPNGWKNSVRHNLSLNKCFEKIEKPVTNGGQRKGCLWAMNPAKITKMDEEVQKWSRKDPMAIRKAMVHPEHLDALERGEMKHGPTGDSDNDEGDNDDADTEDHSDVGEDDDDDDEEEEDAAAAGEEGDDSGTAATADEALAEEIEIEQDAAAADSFIINTPESMVDPEGDEVDVDFDMEVPEFYDDINVDSKEGFTLEFSQKELLALGDEDESVYIASPQNHVNHRIQQQQQQHHQQLSALQQQLQPLAKRARLDVNYAITPPASSGSIVHKSGITTSGGESPQQQRGATVLTIGGTGAGPTVNGRLVARSGHFQPFTAALMNNSGGAAATATVSATTTSQPSPQQFQFTYHQQQQHHHNRRKTPLVTRIG